MRNKNLTRLDTWIIIFAVGALLTFYGLVLVMVHPKHHDKLEPTHRIWRLA